MNRIVSMSRGLVARFCALALVASVAACANVSQFKTGSIGHGGQPLTDMSEKELARAETALATAHTADPADRSIGIGYATVLRMGGRDDEAVDVMRAVATHHPDDPVVLASYGKAQAAVGALDDALDTIRRAQTAGGPSDQPDWLLLSAEGAILDQLDRSEEARRRYREALDIAPDEPSILSNIGMSYLLSGDLIVAESYLSRATAAPGADSRMRQNLALVIGLQGRLAEAERVARAELSIEQAEANVAYLHAILGQQTASAVETDQNG